MYAHTHARKHTHTHAHTYAHTRLQVGTPICVPSQGNAELGRITSMELNHKVLRAWQGGVLASRVRVRVRVANEGLLQASRVKG